MARRISSVSFSGAGFLGSYHLGVSACLQKHKIIPNYTEEEDRSQSITPPVLLGSSAGALVAAGILTGIRTDDAMELTINLSNLTSKNWLNVATPGFSLVDSLHPLLRSAIDSSVAANFEGEGGESEWLRRFVNGRLRVNLTVPKLRMTMKENRVISSFGNLDELVASCVLSSYVPFATGPLDVNAGIAAASNELIAKNQVAIEINDGDSPGKLKAAPGDTGGFIDGGMSAMFPIMDANTLIVSPLPIRFGSGSGIQGRVICPEFDSNLSSSPIFNQGLELVHEWRKNAHLLSSMLISSTSEELEQFYQNGHDDATKFLKESNFDF